MLTMLLILSGLYITYTVAIKSAIRFYMLKRPVYDWMAYAASLAFGGIISIVCSLPIIFTSFMGYSPVELAILPTLFAIGIGEGLYVRQKKWSKKLISQQWKTIEQQSRTKR